MAEQSGKKYFETEFLAQRNIIRQLVTLSICWDFSSPEPTEMIRNGKRYGTDYCVMWQNFEEVTFK